VVEFPLGRVSFNQNIFVVDIMEKALSVQKDDVNDNSVKIMTSETNECFNLDPGTPSFNPLRAIYDPDFQTDESTQCHDNVEKCIAVIEGRVRTPKPKQEAPEKDESGEVKLERQFTPSQMPVAARPRKEFRHVVNRMGEFSSGPLSVLKRCLEEGVRVRVWTRGLNDVRGVTTGFVSAFDKHWNMALTDVDEQFTRRRSRKAPVLGGEVAKGLDKEATEFRVGESVVKILMVKKKVEICVRHVPQVLLRGEHVVMVATKVSSDI